MKNYKMKLREMNKNIKATLIFKCSLINLSKQKNKQVPNVMMEVVTHSNGVTRCPSWRAEQNRLYQIKN